MGSFSDAFNRPSGQSDPSTGDTGVILVLGGYDWGLGTAGTDYTYLNAFPNPATWVWNGSAVTGTFSLNFPTSGDWPPPAADWTAVRQRHLLGLA